MDANKLRSVRCVQGDDFDIYFFLFFILPILVPVAGLGVVVPST
jgi:hypothetical protein